ncbi:AAA family ATPase [Rhodococcus erythropolis]|uniref:AAA family ATPase n=1 Tax=Rhodococcus erythropolis TaxID=1833 RepID=UPI0024B78B32|nr:AAA family ATPase [Rhodococcus erythropolis]MDJ0012671.1 AAA family ATPase [Rhodococcus erythropolis]
MTAPTAAINEFSLQDLITDLKAEQLGAKPKDIAAWNLLVALAEDLAANCDDDTLVRGRRWMLKTISARGFRGAVEPVSVDFVTHPSLTVLHGENGSGKSSLAEAVRVALTSNVGAAHLGSAPKEGLWHSNDFRSRGVPSSEIIVTLVDDHDPSCRLVITTREHDTWVERTATLSDNGTITVITSDSSEWAAWDLAVLANPPVLAYAELFNELRTEKDLHTWLTRCLSIDVATKQFDTAVIKIQAETKSAYDRIVNARMQAQASIDSADSAAITDGVGNVTSILWDEFYEETERDTWIEQYDLQRRVRQQVELPADQLVSLVEWARQFKTFLSNFNDSAASELTPAVIAQLIQLDNALGGQPRTESCPVCGAPREEWQSHLHARMPDFDTTRAATEALRTHCRQRTTELVAPMRRVLEALSSTAENTSAIDTVTALIDKIAAVSSVDDLDPRVLLTLTEWCDWVTTDRAAQLITVAINSADRRHQWLCERWDATEPYLDAWNQDRAEAATADAWNTARTRWNQHLKKLRTARSQTFADLVAPKVAALLADVGLKVDALDVLKGKSTLEIVDSAGLPVDLSYLSAGQRNALILGPVLVAAEGGLFGFCILDDPVHAFDEFRVDQLASTMTSISENQALVIATHDGRFVEYLRVHAPSAFTVFHTSRSADGQITLNMLDSPWLSVLEHANYLYIRGQKYGISDSGIQDIQSLLRMTADSVLEALFLRLNSARSSTARSDARTKFDAAMTTKERIGYFRGSLGRKNPALSAFDRACNHIDAHLAAWNDAMHDAPCVTTADALPAQLADAKQFCQDIEKIGR